MKIACKGYNDCQTKAYFLLPVGEAMTNFPCWPVEVFWVGL